MTFDQQTETRPEWLTEDGWIDPSRIPCPCCAAIPWCAEVAAEWVAEAMSAPVLVMGGGSR